MGGGGGGTCGTEEVGRVGRACQPPPPARGPGGGGPQASSLAGRAVAGSQASVQPGKGKAQDRRHQIQGSIGLCGARRGWPRQPNRDRTSSMPPDLPSSDVFTRVEANDRPCQAMYHATTASVSKVTPAAGQDLRCHLVGLHGRVREPGVSSSGAPGFLPHPASSEAMFPAQNQITMFANRHRTVVCAGVHWKRLDCGAAGLLPCQRSSPKKPVSSSVPPSMPRAWHPCCPKRWAQPAPGLCIHHFTYRNACQAFTQALRRPGRFRPPPR